MPRLNGVIQIHYAREMEEHRRITKPRFLSEYWQGNGYGYRSVAIWSARGPGNIQDHTNEWDQIKALLLRIPLLLYHHHIIIFHIVKYFSNDLQDYIKSIQL